MGSVTQKNLADVIQYHAPTEAMVSAIGVVRMSATDMIRAILENVPDCADRTAAIRKVREAMMTANAAIVLEGLI